MSNMKPNFNTIDGKPYNTSEYKVILDFGNGIRGTVERNGDYSDWQVVRVTNAGRWVADIAVDLLTEPMKTIVQDLLKAQEEA